jgi:hypothetical protein
MGPHRKDDVAIATRLHSAPAIARLLRREATDVGGVDEVRCLPAIEVVFARALLDETEQCSASMAYGPRG